MDEQTITETIITLFVGGLFLTVVGIVALGFSWRKPSPLEVPPPPSLRRGTPDVFLSGYLAENILLNWRKKAWARRVLLLGLGLCSITLAVALARPPFDNGAPRQISDPVLPRTESP
jgi:hypothetical protein